MTTINVDKETRNKLRVNGRKEQTYDDIINELIEISKKRTIDLAESIEQEKV